MEKERILLLDENGNENEFEIVVTFKVDEQEYAILQPCDTGSEEGVIFKIVEENGEEVLEYLTDEEEFERVAMEYEELMKENE